MLERGCGDSEEPHRHGCHSALAMDTSEAPTPAAPSYLKAHAFEEVTHQQPPHPSNHHIHKPNLKHLKHVLSTKVRLPLFSPLLFCLRADRLYSKTSGTVQNTMGKVEETIGNVTGSETWKTSGQERRAQGDTEHREAQTQGYAEGTKDRLLGKKDQVTGAVSGDTSQEATGRFYSYPERLITDR